ncbi:MAG TPA: GGDEF domain-containing protein [Albitalea sp.]|nr:GGDEF domain-containing protein [Albitalea sp.]
MRALHENKPDHRSRLDCAAQRAPACPRRRGVGLCGTPRRAARVGAGPAQQRSPNRQLEASHARLRVASERDPLTDLANRRHFHAVMQASQRANGPGFIGALLMVDIDHFKRINDGHGHAAGDLVLVEVARRLNDAVRGDDLVVRWGGEEFLIVAMKLTTEQTDQLAARVLASIGETPVRAEGELLRITASIGYARFPLPPYGVPVPWEQAINLADMALYTAKSQGRNRAVGVVSALAADALTLRRIEADFDQGWREGRVTLLQTAGPVPSPPGRGLG